MAYVSPSAPLAAARIAGNDSAMDAAADHVRGVVIRIATQHRFTGDYINAVSVANVPGLAGTGRSVRDRLVIAGDPAAVSIEYGHTTKAGNHVPGQYILTQALAKA